MNGSITVRVATALVERTSRRGFERDMRARAVQLVTAVRAPLAEALRRDERAKVRRLLSDLVRDDRVGAVALCDAGDALVAGTPPDCTVAANVTLLPTADGLGADAKAVVVVVGYNTSCASGADVLAW